jgi:hypothetical protein
VCEAVGLTESAAVCNEKLPPWIFLAPCAAVHGERRLTTQRGPCQMLEVFRLGTIYKRRR